MAEKHRGVPVHLKKPVYHPCLNLRMTYSSFICFTGRRCSLFSYVGLTKHLRKENSVDPGITNSVDPDQTAHTGAV